MRTAEQRKRWQARNEVLIAQYQAQLNTRAWNLEEAELFHELAEEAETRGDRNAWDLRDAEAKYRTRAASCPQ